jgi:hypothetical protein
LEPAKPIDQYATVQTWFQGLREHWGEEPPDKEGKLAMLLAFCRMVEKDPDAIIAECSRDVEGGKRIRIKGRREYSEKIEEFKQNIEGGPREQGRAANVIRSFLIHNGIFMQGGVQG